MRLILHGGAILILTILTQIGGLAWLLSRFAPRPLLSFMGLYAALSATMVFVAPLAGRMAVSCLGTGPLVVASPLYCALNRTYVTPTMHSVLHDTAAEMDRRYPGAKTQLLDGNFPLFDGFPLLPHLSHADGRKADIAFYYADENGYRPGAMRSPLGYFAFEPGPTECPHKTISLRWDLSWLQPLMRDLEPDQARMRAVLEILSDDDRVGKVFLEPHLRTTFRATDPKVRFQGCRAARHDDHLHIQL